MAMARPWPDPLPGLARSYLPTRWAAGLRWLVRALVAIHAGDPAGHTSSAAAVARHGEFEAFFRLHERDIFRYLWRLTSDEAYAYDLTQETFLRAWQHYDKVAGYERPGAWLFRVATNLALNYLRHSRTPLGTAAALSERDGMGDDPAWRIVERDHVRRALMALAPRQRAALVLREVYGLTGEELTVTLGISAGAAKTLLWRAREEFRARYLGEGLPEEGRR